MYPLILILHVIIAILLIVVVLIQRGKGASIGAAFGAGASQTVFGSQGSGSFLFKLTGFLAAVFFFSTLALGYLNAYRYQQSRQLDLIPPVVQQEQGVNQFSDSVPVGEENDIPPPISSSLPTEEP